LFVAAYKFYWKKTPTIGGVLKAKQRQKQNALVLSHRRVGYVSIWSSHRDVEFEVLICFFLFLETGTHA
jgi:hypothetical protein